MNKSKKILSMSVDMPWAVCFEIQRLIILPYIRLMFALKGLGWGKRWRIWGMPVIQRYRGSLIKLGDGLLLRSWQISNPVVPNHPVVLATRSSSALIRVGENVGMTGTTIVAVNLVEIGDNVLIGSNTVIVDSDFHPLYNHLRRINNCGAACAPVVIERDVFLGMYCLILKGVTIGEGSVIGGGSVVTQDIPAGVVAAGNPARVVRFIDRD